MRYCLCEGWQDNIAKVDGIFDLAHVHGVVYNGTFFVYCPWCGKGLAEPEKEEEE